MEVLLELCCKPLNTGIVIKISTFLEILPQNQNTLTESERLIDYGVIFYELHSVNFYEEYIRVVYSAQGIILLLMNIWNGT